MSSTRHFFKKEHLGGKIISFEPVNFEPVNPIFLSLSKSLQTVKNISSS